MKCSNCSSDLQQGARFCQTCGLKVASAEACGHCGERNLPGSRFCAGCGVSMIKTSTVIPRETANHIASDQSQTTKQKIGGNLSSVIKTTPYDQAGAEDFVIRIPTDGSTVNSLSSVRIPFGFAAVAVVNGVVKKVENQVRTGNEDFLFGANWWKTKAEQFLQLFKVGPRENVSIFLVNNFKGLSIVTYNHGLPLPGSPDAVLRFDLWVETREDHLGLFFQRVVGNRDRVTVDDLRSTVAGRVRELVGTISASKLEDHAEREALQRKVLDSIGVSSNLMLLRGKNYSRRFAEVGKVALPTSIEDSSGFGGNYRCANCNHSFTERLRFCEECGAKVEHLWKIDASEFLRARNGEEVNLRLSYLVIVDDPDRSQTVAPIDFETIKAMELKVGPFVLNKLDAYIRKLDLADLSDLNTLESLTQELNAVADREFKGLLTDFRILDVRGAAEDWLFRTDALIAEEIRSIETDHRMLSIDEKQLDFKEAQFQLSLRRLQQVKQANDLKLKQQKAESDFKTQSEIQQKVAESELILGKQEVETETQLKEDARELEAESRREDLVLSAELKTEQRRFDRQDRVDDLKHQSSMRTYQRGHDEEINALELGADRLLRERELQSRDDAFRRKEDVLTREENELLREEDSKVVNHEIGLEQKVLDHQLESDRKKAALNVDIESLKSRGETDNESYKQDEKIRLEIKGDEERIRLLRKKEEDKVDLKVKEKQADADLEDRASNRELEKMKGLADLEDRASNRQLEKMKGLAELEARMAAQDFEQQTKLKVLEQEQSRFELELKSSDQLRTLEIDKQRAAEANQFELEKMATLKGLDPAQLLAIQAAQLAKAGGEGNAAAIVQAIAQSQADQSRIDASQKSLTEKEALYREMLTRERELSSSAADEQREIRNEIRGLAERTLDQAFRASERAEVKATDASKEAVRIAEKSNEASMKNMSEVARYAAGARDARQPNTQDKKERPSESDQQKADRELQKLKEENDKLRKQNEQIKSSGETSVSSKPGSDLKPDLSTSKDAKEGYSNGEKEIRSKSLTNPYAEAESYESQNARADRTCIKCGFHVGLRKFCTECGEPQ